MKHLQPTYLTYDLAEVHTGLSQHSLHRVWTQLLPVTTGAPSYQIFQSTADCFQVVMGLHFQIVVLVTAAQHNSEATELLLLFTQATQISVHECPLTLLAPCGGGTTLSLLGTARGSTVAVAHLRAVSLIQSHLYQALCAHCPFWYYLKMMEDLLVGKSCENRPLCASQHTLCLQYLHIACSVLIMAAAWPLAPDFWLLNTESPEDRGKNNQRYSK